MKTFTIEEIKDIMLNEVTTVTVEEENKSWGAVTPRERKLIDPFDLLYQLRKHKK